MICTLFKAYVAAELLYNDINFTKSCEMNQSGGFSPCCIKLPVVQQHGSHILTSILIFLELWSGWLNLVLNYILKLTFVPILYFLILETLSLFHILCPCPIFRTIPYSNRTAEHTYIINIPCTVQICVKRRLYFFNLVWWANYESPEHLNKMQTCVDRYFQ